MDAESFIERETARVGSTAAAEGEQRRRQLASRDEVHRLHALLRRMTTETVDAPSDRTNAPGYYAVFFTDDLSGLKVEYVHANRRGGSS